jgi:hypothetical protein
VSEERLGEETEIGNAEADDNLEREEKISK